MSDYMIIVETDSLKWLLSLAQRKQTIDGKPHAQLYSVILKASDGRLSLCSLVKDGVTSLMRLSIPCTGEGEVVITDIDNTLGVLKYHGGVLNITPSEDKVKFKSSNKQTTLSANKGARAFPHTPETIEQWTNKSAEVSSKINADDLTYTTNNGENLSCKWTFFDLDTTSLYEAVRCDSMNGQKFNQYTIEYNEPKLSITVGKELKGKTNSEIAIMRKGSISPFNATYNGGLEHIFSNLNHDVTIGMWDFTHVNGGYPMLITLGEGDFIFQMSNDLGS
tara:strand:+ start:1154 stop:1987 length:834 start_codon:yes stop_codon:yes gene_type:complete